MKELRSTLMKSVEDLRSGKLPPGNVTKAADQTLRIVNKDIRDLKSGKATPAQKRRLKKFMS
jgi:hypothetical protein